MKIFRSLAGASLDLLGYRIERATNIELVEEVLRTLQPLQTQFPLIRVGSAGDGGYLLPDCLDAVDGVISPGVGDSSVFETVFADKGVPCILIDGTVEEPAHAHSRFSFLKKMLAAHPSGQDSISLDEAVKLLGPKVSNLVLQMDIEGAEWEVLRHISPATLEKFKILVVEFHEFDRRITVAANSPQIKETLEKITNTFVPVHLHVNNYSPPRVMRAKGFRGLFKSVEIAPVFEVTFLRKTDAVISGARSPVPHPLDEDNVPNARNWRTPALWKFDARPSD